MSDVDYHDVSRETWQKHRNLVERYRPSLEAYLEQLCWWNRKVNLVSRNASRSLIWQHITHSLVPLALDLLPPSLPILDAGTGGGLPGVPLAISASNHRFILNDINHKKIAATHQIVRHLSLSNIEMHRDDFATFDSEDSFILISKHSFKFVEVLHFWDTHPQCRAAILYKGADFEEEWKGKNSNYGFRLTAYHLGTHPEAEFYTDKYIVVLQSKSP